MKCLLSFVLASLTLLAAAGAAQDKPDFTGTWNIVGSTPDELTPSQIVVTKDATLLTVTINGQMGEFKTTYKLDGTPGSSPIDFGGNTMDRTTKMTWNENKLTLTATGDMGNGSFEVKSVVSAGPGGTMLVETTFPDFQGGGGPITTKATYKKS
jgi:hypothetical protein